MFLGSTHSTLELPITITPLLQDIIQIDDFTKAIVQAYPNFFKNVTFSDLVKNLNHEPYVELKKRFVGVVALGLAAEENGLTVDNFEFLQVSKWTIALSVQDLADVSNNITLPLRADEETLYAIQDAMFKILEKRFNFRTEEIEEHLNATKDEIFAFLEPGWIKVVNFITEKNILALSRNYTVPPLYIAEALNISLSELYNVTLPQLEDILIHWKETGLLH